MNWLFETLQHNPEIAIFLTLAVGFWLGSLRFGSFSLGAVTSTLLSGGYTNSGTLGVATGYFNEIGLSAEEAKSMAGMAAVAYAVTYPFGTAGASWFIASLGPKLLKADIAEGSKELERTMGVRASEPGVGSAYRPVATRAYRVENRGLVGRNVCDLAATLGLTDTFIMRVRQGGGVIDPNNGTSLQSGATVAIAGPQQALLGVEKMVGPEVDDAELLGFAT